MICISTKLAGIVSSMVSPSVALYIVHPMTSAKQSRRAGNSMPGQCGSRPMVPSDARAEYRCQQSFRLAVVGYSRAHGYDIAWFPIPSRPTAVDHISCASRGLKTIARTQGCHIMRRHPWRKRTALAPVSKRKGAHDHGAQWLRITVDTRATVH